MLQAVPSYLRSHGTLSLRFEQRAGKTVLRRRQEGGCLRVRVPRGPAVEAVVINTSGGLCGGDSIDQRVAWAEDTASLLTTQAAEKVYGSTGPACTVATRLHVGPRASAEWLPQETILFDGARLERMTDIALEADAALLWCESVVFGRLARGEQCSTGQLLDRVRVRRGGALIYADALALGKAPAAQLSRPALGNGALASAVLLAIGGDALTRLDAVRAALEDHPDVLAGASLWNGILAVRLLARDPPALRRCLAASLKLLRGRPDLPGLWRC
ncbi:urease accessory protein [Sphingobium sp. B2D3A]|uniref:urease accessory protein UreD n=1 Tax=unclassified Sphingobium TaxID=2611147 RepID=UPI002225372F|nr:MULTISPECIES: urease accessory protein UreD [unclassified Sphingobium]MCW2336090.1 urease accessory protein [Sphingobium sp. B2D3A]MCW2380490.1 urease accessory protein [Sphingobium sp. B2D3B]MCW2385845.1 urease accessory protein [Sphingobium sp. B2D3D]MCW2399403.1 urease accessory protein [Sphingobium sp. B2D3C]